MEKETTKKIIEFINESESVMAILRGEAIDQTQNWKKYPSRRKAVDERINKLSEISEELETSLNSLSLEKDAEKKGMVSTEDYNKLLKERDARPNIDLETWNDYKDRPTLDQYENRPNITVEKYNSLLNNQKPTDYDDIKSELNKWKTGLGDKTFEQVQKDLNRVSELEKRPAPEQLSNLQNIINKLPGLVNEKGEIDEDLLTLLTNALSAFKKLENEKGEGEEQVMPTEEDFLKFLKEFENDETESGDDEVYWLNIKLTEKERQNTKLKKESNSLKTAEADRKKKLKQQEEKEKQTRKEIKTELESIDYSTTFPGRLTRITDEKLTNFSTRLQEMEGWLVTGTDEQQKAIREEYSRLEKLSERLELEEKRRDTKRAITNDLEKPVKVKREQLLEARHRNYFSTLDQINDLDEITNFEREILTAIAEQRKENETIKEALSWAEETIKNRDVGQAIEARKYLLNYHWLQRKQKKVSVDYYVLLNKMDEFHALIGKLNSFIKEQKEQEKMKSQIVQSPK